MKGKIILAFVFALLALTLIGLVGQSTLTQLIVSIKKDSEPNQKLSALKEVLTALSDAENSVRTYTITRESENLTPFYESISTIDYKIHGLYESIDNNEQLLLIDSMKSLIEQKYSTLKELIDVKNDHDTEEVLARVLENIARIRRKDSIPKPITSRPTDIESYYERIKKVDIPEPKPEPRKLSIFQRIFGTKDKDDQKAVQMAESEPSVGADVDTVEAINITRSYIPPISDNDVNSSDIGHIISRIGRESNKNVKAIKEQELSLTLQDNELTQQIRKIANQIEDREKWISLNRAQAAQAATNKATDIISITWIIALIIFALLLFIIFNDIARNTRNKEQLKSAKERAEKLAKVKEEFLSNMSHEIRTPLNSIIGYTEQLEHTVMAPSQQKYLTSIHHSGNHLLRIINDILDFAKLEAGKLSLESIGFRIVDNIEEVVESFQSQVDQKNLEIKYSVDQNIPEVVIGDPVRFRQILLNLLSNAIKFTPAGSVDIKVEQQEQKYDIVKLRLTLTDTGIGIPKDKLNYIFQNFSQVDSSTTRKFGGTGLGLSIVKKIVDMHDGHISVESDEGKGTTFIIDLKYKTGTQNDLPDAPDHFPVRYDGLAGKRIMVVDDQEYNLQLIKLIFDKWQVACTLSSSGKEALELWKQQDYDLILMDIQMPEMSGPETTTQIRLLEQGADRHIPIVALTAAASAEESEQCSRAGMDDYLLKPFTQHTLYMNLIKILGIKHHTTEVASNENGAATNYDEKNELDLAELDHLSNGDPSFVRNMLRIFKTNFEEDLYLLRQGLENKNREQIRAKAHKMIPPCSHLHLNRLATLLKQIERTFEDQDLSKPAKLIAEVTDQFNKVKPILEKEINRQEKYPSESAA